MTAPAPTKDTNPKDRIAANKIPLSLLSPIACAKWALAQFSGLLKYGSWNWRIAGVRSSVYLDAARRHLDAYVSGEAADPVDGTDHRANVMACMAILIDAEAAGKLTDDRPPSVDVRPAYAESEALMVRLREQYKDKDPRHYTIADTAVADAAAKADAALRAVGIEPAQPEPTIDGCKIGDTVDVYSDETGYVYLQGVKLTSVTGSGTHRFDVVDANGTSWPFGRTTTRLQKVAEVSPYTPSATYR